MAVRLARVGRPSNADLLEREVMARSSTTALLSHALQHLNHPSRLADSPLCQLAAVREQATTLRSYRYPRAHIVIQAVRRAYDLAWAELGETADAGCLVALADALAGLSRDASARKAGVSVREITRRRREAIDMIVDHLLPVLYRSDDRRPTVGGSDVRPSRAASGTVA